MIVTIFLIAAVINQAGILWWMIEHRKSHAVQKRDDDVRDLFLKLVQAQCTVSISATLNDGEVDEEAVALLASVAEEVKNALDRLGAK